VKHTIMFRFRPEVSPDRQETVIERIRAWNEVGQVSRLNPGASLPEILRICYAYLRDAAEVGTVLDRLTRLPEIEAASAPAERHLIR
jgi:hypothetical protein